MFNKRMNSRWNQVIIIAICTMMLMSYIKSASAENKDDDISVKVEALDKGISVSVVSIKLCSLHLYIFNMDGNLVKRYEINGNTLVTNASLSRGTYLYDVFHEDAKLKSGKILIK